MLDPKVRACVRVIIINADKVCIIEPIRWGTSDIFDVTVPGGGVEEGRTEEQTAMLECLEEVGIEISNPTYTGIEDTQPSPFFNKKGILVSNTTYERYYVAGYAGINKRLFNSEGDGCSYTWMTPDEAIAKIKAQPTNKLHAKRIEALLYAKELISKKMKNFYRRW